MTDQEFLYWTEERTKAAHAEKDALVDILYSSLQERENFEYTLSNPVAVQKYGRYGSITIHKLYIYHSVRHKKEKYVYMVYVNTTHDKFSEPSEYRHMTVRQIKGEEIKKLVNHLIEEGLLDETAGEKVAAIDGRREFANSQIYKSANL